MTRWFRRVRFFFRPRRRWAGVTVPVGESRTPPASQPYPHLLQDLAVVVISATDALEGGVQDPPGLTLDDPSSPGPSTSWGTGVLGHDPVNNDPITGASDGSRNPGGPNSGGQVSGRKRRKGGSGRQPNKNTLTLVTAGAPHHCFQGQIVGTVTKPPPDPYGFNGTSPSFVGVLCAGYNPPVLPGPTTALTTRLSIASPYSAADTILLDEIAHYLRIAVGSDSYLTVTSDLLSLGSLTSACTGQPCGGAPVPSVAGTGVGTIIAAG